MAEATCAQRAGHMKSTQLLGVDSTGTTETAFTAERNEFKSSTAWTSIHGTAVGRVITMNHPVDVFNDGRTRMEFVNDVFIIISKDGL